MDGTSTADVVTSVIESAGTTLGEQFGSLVNTLVPIVMGIAFTGLGFYAIVFLFKQAKKFFEQATK